MAFSFNAFSYEGEIVVNKKGQPVLLKNDNTWEILNPSGLHNKVVFTIIDSFNNIYIYGQLKMNGGAQRTWVSLYN